MHQLNPMYNNINNFSIHTLICVTSPSCFIELNNFGGKSLTDFSCSEVSSHSSITLSCNVKCINIPVTCIMIYIMEYCI